MRKQLSQTDSAIHFLLVPDAGAARRLRRMLASAAPRTGVVVGTFNELAHQARDAYLTPSNVGSWEAALSDALVSSDDAFWSRSYAVAPIETAATIGQALSELVVASNTTDLPSVDGLSLSTRAAGHYADLARLYSKLGGLLPDQLALIWPLLEQDANQAIRKIHVYRHLPLPALNTWQEKLVYKLNDDAAIEPSCALQTMLEASIAAGPSARTGSLLNHIQTSLYTAADKLPLDGTVQWVGARDWRQEAEVAAGMAQQLLADDPKLSAADIGVLLPEAEIYTEALADSFDKAGLPLSGLPANYLSRDLGRDVLFHFLLCRQQPAPAMAVAACLSSPLMPWDRALGLQLANEVMDGRYQPRLPKDSDKDARHLLSLIFSDQVTPAELVRDVKAFVARLKVREDLSFHLETANDVATQICAELEGQSDIEWDHLRSLTTPNPLREVGERQFSLEGITVWIEGQLSWRGVKHLLVLGFMDRHYPQRVPVSPVFFATDLGSLNAGSQFNLLTPDDELAQRRELIRAQLCSVSKTATFLSPRRDGHGKSLAPSTSLVFMHQLIAEVESADDLLVDVDEPGAAARINNLAIADSAAPSIPRELSSADLQLDRNLLALRLDDEGKQKPESPSGLETLLVSPLGWLLRRSGFEPVAWAPAELDPPLKGSIAHEVFEHLFQPNAPAPCDKQIDDELPALFDAAVKRIAPFLRANAWRVERRHLRKEIIKAAIHWAQVLRTLNAEVIEPELWLQGTFDGQPIHGQADALLKLPDGQLLVVDFKKSSSGSRQSRMDKGYDSQASLYRRMIETGGPKKATEPVINAISESTSIGILYYLMNDQGLLADCVVPGAERVPGWVPFDDSVSDKALAIILERIGQIVAGRIQLDAIDETLFERKTGIKPYALDISPLIRLCKHVPASGGEL